MVFSSELAAAQFFELDFLVSTLVQLCVATISSSECRSDHPSIFSMYEVIVEREDDWDEDQ